MAPTLACLLPMALAVQGAVVLPGSTPQTTFATQTIQVKAATIASSPATTHIPSLDARDASWCFWPFCHKTTTSTITSTSTTTSEDEDDAVSDPNQWSWKSKLEEYSRLHSSASTPTITPTPVVEARDANICIWPFCKKSSSASIATAEKPIDAGDDKKGGDGGYVYDPATFTHGGYHHTSAADTPSPAVGNKPAYSFSDDSKGAETSKGGDAAWSFSVVVPSSVSVIMVEPTETATATATGK